MKKGKKISYNSHEKVSGKISILGGFSEEHRRVHCLLTKESADQDSMIKRVAQVQLDPKTYFVVLDNWAVHSVG